MTVVGLSLQAGGRWPAAIIGRMQRLRHASFLARLTPVPMTFSSRTLACLLFGLVASAGAHVSPQQSAQPAVKVERAWVRPTVPGQQGSGGYMKLTAREGQRLVGASSPVAGVTEIHEMKMDGNVMTMRPAGVLALPAGKAVEFRPGGLHLMLMDLKQPLVAGSSVPLTLLLKDGRGIESRVETQLLVSPSAPGGGGAADTRKH